MYYPKSKIKSGFYTSGNDYIVKSTGKMYTGFFYKTFDGKFFSGIECDGASLELVELLNKNRTTTPYQNSLYRLSKSTSDSIVTECLHYFPRVTEKDYMIGYINRYFIKRVNGNSSNIIEVSREDHLKAVKDPIYKTAIVKWKLVGTLYDYIVDPNNPIYGVWSTNERTLILKNYQFPGIGKYLKDLIQFARILPTPVVKVIKKNIGFGSIMDQHVSIPNDQPVVPFVDIYIGVRLTNTLPTPEEILLGTRVHVNPASDVPADWITMTAAEAMYAWFFIPYGAPENIKNHWYVNILNQGAIGETNALWETLTPVTVDGVDGYVSLTAYPTQFADNIALQNI